MDNSIARFQISADEDFRIQFVFVGLSLAGRTLRILVKERASNILRATLTLGAGLTLDGADTLTATVSQATASAWAKGEFETDLHDITGGANTRLVGARTVYDLPGRLPYGVIGAKATVQWVINKAVVTAIGGIGPSGPVNTLAIGTVATLETGQPATAEITGTAPNQVLNLGLPKGNGGDVGRAGTITVGSVTTGAPGSSVVISNVGTSEDAVLNITIPRGATGLTGDKGWSPILAIVPDGIRYVFQLVDWTGGQGIKPAAGLYVGASGLTNDIADAINIRGPQGPSGSVTDGDKGDIVVSGSGSTWTVDARSVDFSKLRAIATARLLGRNTSGSGDVEELSPSVARFILQITSQGEAIILASDAATQRAAMGAAAASPGDFVLTWTASAPSGTMKANGAAVSRTTYAALDTAIYCGDANNPTADWGYRCTDPLNPSTTRSTTGTHIVLPDGRGEFFRGFDDGRGVDSGRNLWRAQAQAIQSHTHGINDPGHTHSLAGGPNANGSGTVAPGAQSGNSTFVGGMSAAVTGITIQSAGGTETRPRNLSPLVCIRY